LFETIRIPKERIGVLIGTKGNVKRKLEKLAGVSIEVDGETGEVDIEGKENTANFYDAVNVVKAIGRGFSPENAFILLGEEMLLEVIKVSDVVGGSEKAVQTKKARVIGTGGKAREAIENASGAKISVLGKTIAIIGNHEAVGLARETVEMLLAGATHRKAMDFLNREKAGREKFTI
jgi:ribosomal RNA assembly protein